jgi:RHH-type proline utilization regulon transcriptional repressor/proline dehydrogenase/delta 1-pyrroline-5-carboxylate dehydrogenase
VNRNVIGAVVGVQPFGGEGLSGTGPKAGGALYLQRLLATRPQAAEGARATLIADGVAEGEQRGNPAAALTALRDWLIEQREPALAARCDGYLSQVPAGATAVLPGRRASATRTHSARAARCCVSRPRRAARARNSRRCWRRATGRCSPARRARRWSPRCRPR